MIDAESTLLILDAGTHVAYLKSWCIAVLLVAALARTGPAQVAPLRAPLLKAHIDDIVRLESIEDRREFDAAALNRIAASNHAEVRRRAALTIARLYDFRGRELLRAMRADADTAVAATVVFATGQLLDTASVEWLDFLMRSPNTPVGVAVEAAVALGKIRTSDSRARLALYLSAAEADARSEPVIAEALLSIGRFRERGDIEPIVRWAYSLNEELRWRAAWALFRPRDPAAVPDLLALARDTSAAVRFWAVRGLSGPRADSSAARASGVLPVLLESLEDRDRRVVAEAVRTLGTHDDAISMIQLALRVDDSDPWIAVNAAEALGQRGDRVKGVLGQLTAATAAARPPAVRAAALVAIADVWLAAALEPATRMAADTSRTVRLAAAGVLGRLRVGGKEGLKKLLADRDARVRGAAQRAWLELADTVPELPARRAARRAALASPDAVVRAAAVSSMKSWADTADVPALLEAYARAQRDTAVIASEAVLEVLGDLQKRRGVGAAAFFARFPKAPGDVQWGNAVRAFGESGVKAWGDGRPMHPRRTEADYRRIVDQYVVRDYNGAPRPRVLWETNRGAIETELYAGDAPLATDYLVSLASRGKLAGVAFERVVPNFVAQQGAVEPEQTLLRDEVSRHRLTRGNLSWGSVISQGRSAAQAFDTGPAVYTFGITPQPHNEGDFTALGRVVKGMDVVDRIELGDVVRRARIVAPGGK